MHIGFLTPEYPDDRKPEGGLGNYIRKIAIELIALGHKATVFVLAARNSYQEDAGIKVRYVPRIRFHWRLKQNQVVAAWLELLERRINARRMHSAVIAYHRSSPLDIVQTSNYSVLGYFLRHNPFFPLVCRCSSYAPMLRSANGLKRKLPEAVSDWMEARLVSAADAAFAPSQLVADTYKRFEAVKLNVIRTPVEPPNRLLDDSIYRALADGRKYLLYFGTLNGIKGVDVLIQAAPGILSRYKDLSLIFIGPNHILPDGTRAVDKLQSELGIFRQEGRVIYSPALPKAQLFPIILNAFGVILPSRVDNYPNTCLEALALDVPVVGTYDSSLDEMIENGITGFLAENGDSVSLQAAVFNLLDQTPQQRATMLQIIRQTMGEITMENRIGTLLQFYQGVISNYSRN